MKTAATKFLTLVLFVSSAVPALADDQFWYFTSAVEDVFYYTRIVRCPGKNGSSSDAVFSAGDIVGPFDDYAAAESSRDQAVRQARKSGKQAKFSLGVCVSGN